MSERVLHSMPIVREVAEGPGDVDAGWTAAVRRARTNLDLAAQACRRHPLCVYGPYRLEQAADGTRWVTCTARDHLYASERTLRALLPERADGLLGALGQHGLRPNEAEFETIASSYGLAGQLVIANCRDRREWGRAPRPANSTMAAQIAALNGRWRAEASR